MIRTDNTAEPVISISGDGSIISYWRSGSVSDGYVYHIRAKKNGEATIKLAQPEHDGKKATEESVPVKVTDYIVSGYGVKVPYSVDPNPEKEDPDASETWYTISIGDVYEAAGYDTNVKVSLYVDNAISNSMIYVKCKKNNGTGNTVFKHMIYDTNAATSFAKMNDQWEAKDGLPARALVFILTADELKAGCQSDQYSGWSSALYIGGVLNEKFHCNMHVEATTESPFAN